VNLKDAARLLRFLYASAARVTEVCGLIWNKIQAHADGTGQVTFLGKGSKTRHFFMTASVYQEMMARRSEAADEIQYFRRGSRAIFSGHRFGEL
jgi:site-specific recombinase XerD